MICLWSTGNVLVKVPRFIGSNLAEVDGSLRAIKIHSTTSFRREVKLRVPCHAFMACKRTFHTR
jgi:hypothetical protein